MSHTQPHPGDKGAAFKGLIIGVISLMAILYTVVYFTNKKFEGHEAAPAPATGTTPAH
jgi:hypothetical protein